ncbi:MAG: bifunctional (p)ppGpp synthetase/guanosine-3',5'-bis(diphosphate) 3'-pyrophosphohydrolase [Candidatus Vogelbacteria bacterium]|nr:bifunctional (p)ppGpp synthetase/guanosine-3',5'-bis(diphosphate) 3'-pyrophosphohydrolase [Candidatus Vogelbacteria bacterium]
MAEISGLKELIDLLPADTQIGLIERAYTFATQAHAGQKRFSGEDYITHPVEVAKILATMRADIETIVAGLLHDVLEDTTVTRPELVKEFGETVTFLVDGVTKLGQLKYQGVERHVESLRKLFVAMAKDLRVIMIRLADRLHNIRTLNHIPKNKQKRIAIETLEIYAPLANRLGMWKIKGSLEDSAFPYAYPKEYALVVTLRKTKGRESVKRLEKLYRTLSREAITQGIKDIKIEYRIKYLYSLYEKLKKHDMNIDQIYDLSALRVIVPTVADCYQILGLIHTLWKPVSGRLKDYVANPKPNGYQSIHTTIFVGDNSMAEVQIRTELMHEKAEYGVASHLIYDEHGKTKKTRLTDPKLAWLNKLLEWQKHPHQSEDYLAILKTDFFEDRIFVFTPKGDVIELPVGATPLDFAYAIHSEIGDHANGATVNGKFVALMTPLKTDDIVLIETKKSSKPSVKWLEHVKTGMARKHIKSYIQKLN